MEHKWIWMTVAALFIFLGLLFSKGSFMKALIASFVAPLVIAPVYMVIYMALTSIGGLIVNALSSGKVPGQTIADFGIAGAIASTVGLFVTYCIWDREVVGIEVQGVLEGPSNSGSETAAHPFKKTML